MAVKMLITNCIISTALVLLLQTTESVHGRVTCYSTRITPFYSPTECYGTLAYCCGTYNDQCCSSSDDYSAVFGILFFLLIFVCCPWMCYRCCCKRTTRGVIYHTPQPGTATSVSVTLPPQQVQQVPYPTVVPYPQQTPYPPQYATNPYYNMPPPAYGVAIQGETQQAPNPTAPNAPAPYLHS